jgi:hypothetical protein
MLKKQLSNASFVKVDRREASQLVRNPAELSDAGNLYLVRASAFDLDQQYIIVSRLAAYLLPEERALSIVNTSLNHPDAIPKNFAIVVETDAEIQKAEIICLTAR